MKAFRACFIFVAAATMTASQAQDTYTLRRALVEGEKTVYKMTTVSDIKLDLSAFGQGEIPMTMTNDLMLLLTVGKVDKEKNLADVKGDVSDFKMTIEPQMPGIPEAPSKFEMTAKMDAFGEVKDVELKGLDGMMKAMAGGNFTNINGIVFPENALKIGDTWKMPALRKSSLGDTESDVTCTLKGIKKVEGKDLYEVAVKGKVKSTSDVKDDTTGQQMKTTTNLSVDGTVLIDKASGAVVKYTVSGPIAIDSVMGEMTIPMKGTYTSVLELVPAKAEGVKAKE